MLPKAITRPRYGPADSDVDNERNYTAQLYDKHAHYLIMAAKLTLKLEIRYRNLSVTMLHDPIAPIVPALLGREKLDQELYRH